MTHSIETIQSVARALRYWIITSTTQAGSGHVSSSMSSVELVATLFSGGYFASDVSRPEYPNNDRLIFSKGHASPLFYALWALAGAMPVEDLLTLRHFMSPLEGHPTKAFPMTEVPTGSLGQGLSVGVGMALHAHYIDFLPYRTWVLLGDSEMAEGSNWEALQIASHYNLSQLIGIVDVNRLGQRGETLSGHDTSRFATQAQSFGWETREIDGHNIQSISEAYDYVLSDRTKPLLIIAKTFKGKGVACMENKEGWHGKALNEQQANEAIAQLGSVEPHIRIHMSPPEKVQPRRYYPTTEYKVDENYVDPLAPRKAYGHALVALHKAFPNMVVLDAEMSNSTFSETFAQAYPSRFFEMYIAEQNMVGVASGLATRGALPWISTFGAFFTRAYDQLRMASYAHVPIVCVGSHVGLSAGQDGASQMAIEDVAMFRSLHNAVVVAPADHVAVEKIARELVKHDGISYMRLGRNDAEALYSQDTQFRIGGSHVLRSTQNDHLTIITNGAMLYESLKAHDMLRDVCNVRVIDAYSIAPIDTHALVEASLQTRALLVVEDHGKVGGLADAVRDALAGRPVRIYACTIDKMPRTGKPEELYDYMGLSSEKLVEKIHEIMRSL